MPSLVIDFEALGFRLGLSQWKNDKNKTMRLTRVKSSIVAAI
jgi:hypothetical protein